MQWREWRLTEDFMAEPHAEAARMAMAGRPATAISFLEAALQREPGREDLRNHLHRIQRQVEHNLVEDREYSRLVAALHDIAAMLIFAVSVIACLGVFNSPFLLRDWTQEFHESPGIFVTLMLFLTILGLLFVPRLFCHLWFAYLARLPYKYALIADFGIQRFSLSSSMGQTYIDTRGRFFAERYGRPVPTRR